MWAFQPSPKYTDQVPTSLLEDIFPTFTLLFPALSFFIVIVPGRNITINIQNAGIFPILNKILTAYSIPVSGAVLFPFRAKVLKRAGITYGL